MFTVFLLNMRRIKTTRLPLPPADIMYYARIMDSLLVTVVSPISILIKKETMRRAMKNPEYAYLHKVRLKAATEAGVDERILIVSEKYGLHFEDWRKQQDILASAALPAWIRKPIVIIEKRPITLFLSSHYIQDSSCCPEDKTNCVLSQQLAGTLGQQLKDMSENLQCYPPSHESLEDWRTQLEEAASKLLAYADYHSQATQPVSCAEPLKNKIMKEERIVSDAKQAMHWVAENLDNLWN